jgi:hypothetical protein
MFGTAEGTHLSPLWQVVQGYVNLMSRVPPGCYCCCCCGIKD